jgi:3-hydroxyacyl-CoA dehydrogenase
VKVAVVGTGVIGVSWARLFLSHGHEVVATDPAAPSDLPDGVAFTHDLAEAVADADFVQENGPERPDLKRALFRTMDSVARPETVLASSSSGLMPTDIQADCGRHPERVLVGHPFNPPHLIPLVEVVGGAHTSPDAVARAMDFYRSLGKKPVQVRTELPGHIANRLQAALWREAYSLVEQGAATVADIDAAIAYGPGPRWALLGPFATQHLSGGPGGLRHVLEHLGPPTAEWWKTMRTPELTPSLVETLVSGVDEELSGVDTAAMLAERDALLTELLAAKARATDLP